MRVWPVSNGTPDNSLEFILERGFEGNAFGQLKALLGEPAMRFVSYVGFSDTRWTVFGPAFERLVKDAGPRFGCGRGPGCGVWHGPDGHERPRTARELCEWLEAQLNAGAQGRE